MSSCWCAVWRDPGPLPSQPQVPGAPQPCVCQLPTSSGARLACSLWLGAVPLNCRRELAFLLGFLSTLGTWNQPRIRMSL